MNNFILRSLVATAMALALVGSAQAANGTWSNTATDWNTNTSWSGSIAPGNATADRAIFDAATPSFQPKLSGSVTTGGINFTTATGGWTISSNTTSQTLTLLAVGTAATSSINATNTSGTNTISAPIILGGQMLPRQRSRKLRGARWLSRGISPARTRLRGLLW